ncbi:hypothetical protein PHMEG_00026725 [Phytophthora megakarya]|uniref:ZSWIM1/3 RNaseH-like domain-containing protein n=1 Tax=Phytophthora megakarya TaxID=4795 RepID=A0A225VBH5_9STRA|nr:hypothetical protein PHMEG_00026725 [Phytophthora megakarya]
MLCSTYTSPDDNLHYISDGTHEENGIFTEALFIDATYETNVNRYRLFGFMVTDNFGSGSFAQHALIDGESKRNMKTAFQAFKQIILHIDVLAEELPDTTVILCHF